MLAPHTLDPSLFQISFSHILDNDDDVNEKVYGYRMYAINMVRTEGEQCNLL